MKKQSGNDHDGVMRVAELEAEVQRLKRLLNEAGERLRKSSPFELKMPILFIAWVIKKI